MRTVQVTDTGWLEYAGEFLKHKVKLVVRTPAKVEQGIDAIIIRAPEWPVAPSRKHFAPIIVYGSAAELQPLQDEPVGYLLDVDALSVPAVVSALQVLWREGERGAEVTFEDEIQAKGLTPRESEVARRWRKGETREETAKALGMSPATVRTHRSSIMTKLGGKPTRM